MIHMNSYFEVDWQASADNLKGMLKGKITYSVLAEVMCVETKTIYNWVNNKTTPSMNDLVLLAKFLNVDILDILVIKGERDCPITRDDVISAIDLEHKVVANLEDKTVKNDFPCKESVAATVIRNEYQRQHNKISNLNEFLLYLPLCDLLLLADMLLRINGNLKHKQHYIEEQLDYLYRKIPESPAKTYADQRRYFYLTPPSIYDIDESTKDIHKLEKVEAYMAWEKSADTQGAERDYQKKYSGFLKRLTTLERVKALLERIESDDYF